MSGKETTSLIALNIRNPVAANEITIANQPIKTESSIASIKVKNTIKQETNKAINNVKKSATLLLEKKRTRINGKIQQYPKDVNKPRSFSRSIFMQSNIQEIISSSEKAVKKMFFLFDKYFISVLSFIIIFGWLIYKLK
ncbi:hypothetical protein ACFFLS_01505 [Flavobacterium procerum]|uniref:Uncharacterized protein n=1 Tax=Flavobacterium procerum TaxID=1455569 RepID=A0ABV6BM33_9FLAO